MLEIQQVSTEHYFKAESICNSCLYLKYLSLETFMGVTNDYCHHTIRFWNREVANCTNIMWMWQHCMGTDGTLKVYLIVDIHLIVSLLLMIHFCLTHLQLIP